ncbi:hypothetical protein J6590_059467 [Homalodisca vitripennis]|nr:hypothetical protein J6590_059467 [Homalodisca vitripennis]
MISLYVSLRHLLNHEDATFVSKFPQSMISLYVSLRYLLNHEDAIFVSKFPQSMISLYVSLRHLLNHEDAIFCTPHKDFSLFGEIKLCSAQPCCHLFRSNSPLADRCKPSEVVDGQKQRVYSYVVRPERFPCPSSDIDEPKYTFNVIIFARLYAFQHNHDSDSIS